ncbi:hypothetical protein LJR034_002225 [Caballeronia sp. LjRoot34]|uniref:hypothetical protein n=1 Tax=Caballeronia sp. LjRoot34 TaxID=3342325 RepID=UPI003ED10C66
MLTGLRPGVIASAPQSEIDLDAAEWHIPGERMKMRHDHIVPLPRQALLERAACRRLINLTRVRSHKPLADTLTRCFEYCV